MNLFREKSEWFSFNDFMGRNGIYLVDVFTCDEPCEECFDNPIESQIIIVFTEVKKNKGPSITNVVEHIIPQYCEKNKITLSRVLMFLERYEGRQELDQIFLGKNLSPNWRRLSDNEATPILNVLDYPYPISDIPRYCNLPLSDHRSAGGCWGISNGELARIGELHCKNCEYKKPDTLDKV